MTIESLSGIILDDRLRYSLDELAEICVCRRDWIIELVEEGILEPAGDGPDLWQFSGQCLLRVRTAVRLERDLDINLAGIALALQLLDEITELRARLSPTGIPEKF